jgi:hypothetical protein
MITSTQPRTRNAALDSSPLPSRPQRRQRACCFRHLRVWAVSGAMRRARLLVPALEAFKRAVSWARLAMRDARLWQRRRAQADLLRAWRQVAAMEVRGLTMHHLNPAIVLRATPLGSMSLGSTWS